MKIRAVLDTSALIGIQRHELVFPAGKGYYTIVWSPFVPGTRPGSYESSPHPPDRQRQQGCG
jgi:hypothetical protein